jgi:hypothetical protein
MIYVIQFKQRLDFLISFYIIRLNQSMIRYKGEFRERHSLIKKKTARDSSGFFSHYNISGLFRIEAFKLLL